jgi:hypothetical protein
MGHFEYDHRGKKTWVETPPPMGRVDPEIEGGIDGKINLSNKIFGIGYPKTGSSSAAAALVILGYKAMHDTSNPIWNLPLKNDFSELKAIDFDAYMNVFPKAFYLYDITFPNSKFILTTREPHSWLESLIAWRGAHDSIIDGHSSLKGYLETLDDHSYYAATDMLLAYGSLRTHTESYIYKLEQHTREVEYYFRERPDDLLVLPLDSPNKSVLLSNFLSKDWPAEITYPHVKPKGNPYKG